MGPGRASAWDDPRWELLERLGEGTMGVVFRARERATGRQVAIKWLRVDALEPRRVARFAREGELLARLRHPGILRVHAAGLAGGRPFLVTDLVEGGRTLRQALEQAPLTRRVELVRDVARALGQAHAQGIVHRDVKPENVLLEASGRPLVADFGAALAAGTERLTRTGAVVGTPLYMAPEQWQGEEVGPRADVWSLGVILYEALTGSLPFEAAGWVELMAALERPPLPPRQRNPQVSTELEGLTLATLARFPRGRPADGEALAQALDACLAGRPWREAAPGRGRRAALAGLAGALALVPLGLWLRARGPAPPAPGPDPAPAASPLRPPVANPAPPADPTSPAVPVAPPTPRGPPARIDPATLPSPPPTATLAQVLYEGARQGEPFASRRLAAIYEHGSADVTRDPALALAWFRVAAQSRDPGAIVELIEHHDQVDAVEREHWLAILAAVGEDPAQPNPIRAQALRHLSKWRLADNVDLLTRAVALGDGEAAFLLGGLLEPRDPAEAMRLYRLATERGLGWAILGNALERGVGGPPDLAQAIACYERGLKEEDPYAAYYLGVCLVEGRGTPKNLARGRQLLRLAEAATVTEVAPKAARLLERLGRE